MASDVDILVVDDRPENLVAVEAILSGDNYRLVTASSGPDALRRILEQDFAVLLIDVVMPGMDGFEVAELAKQRERSRHTPIIFLSAGGWNMDFIYRAYSVGAVDYLAKPINPDMLRAKVRIFVDLFVKDRCIREQAEALRVASEQRYRNLAEAIPQIVWTATADGSITYFNRRWAEYTGQPAADAAGDGWMSALAADDVERHAAAWRDGVSRGDVFELECRVRGGDGAYRWHLCRAVPEIEGGRIVAWLGTFTDCDAIKRECEIAERAVYARDEFLSVASHELRTPLSTLLLRLKSLHRLDVASEARKVDACLRQSTRLVTLVDSLFDFSRITTGRLGLQYESFDLVESAREAAARLDEHAALAGARVEICADRAVRGRWDRLRVEQVIENLLSNAIKYAAGQPITVAIDTHGDLARLAVSDRGPGIARSDLARIFEPFERASSTVAYAGMGLGLFIAREYAAAHGGTIAVSSVPGEGTTFTVELPRAEAS
jgi:PAS domain S-box-containing protein